MPRTSIPANSKGQTYIPGWELVHIAPAIVCTLNGGHMVRIRKIMESTGTLLEGNRKVNAITA